jgi:hypothetical protein
VFHVLTSPTILRLSRLPVKQTTTKLVPGVASAFPPPCRLGKTGLRPFPSLKPKSGKVGESTMTVRKTHPCVVHTVLVSLFRATGWFGISVLPRKVHVTYA